MQTNTFSVRGAYELALEWWRNEAQYVYYLLLPSLVAVILADLLVSPESVDAFMFTPGTGIIWMLLQILYFLLLTAATASLLFFVATGKKEKWENWGKYLRILPKYIAVNVLFALMVMVGLIFLIIPGVYLALRYAFVGYRTLEHPEESISNLFAQEANRTAGHRWGILGICITLMIATAVIMSIVAIVTAVLPDAIALIVIELTAFLFTVPLALLTGQAAYTLLNKEFQGNEKSTAAEAAPVVNAEVIEVGA